VLGLAGLAACLAVAVPAASTGGGAVAAAVAAAAGATGASAGVAFQPAAGGPVTGAYSCAVPVAGTISFSAQFTVSGVPASVAAGGQVTVTGYQASVEIPASFVDDLLSLGATSPLTGDVDKAYVDASDATPSTINPIAKPIGFSVPLVQGSPADVKSPAVNVGPFTAGASGTVQFTPGSFVFSGDFPVLGSTSITCTLTTKPAPVVASVPIVSTGSLAFKTSSLAAGNVAISYRATLAASGGKPPYRFAIAGGSLSAGLALGAANGEISGVPTKQGSSTVTFKVTDSSANQETATSAPLALTIGPAPALSTVEEWGRNGDPGLKSTTDSTTPVAVTFPYGTAPTAVAAGANFSLALAYGGGVVAWGDGGDGQLGDGSTATAQGPRQVQLPPGVVATAVAAGGYEAYALTSAGQVYAWGANYSGALGNRSTASSDTPVRVALPAGAVATAIAAGGAYGLALTSSHKIYAWGDGAAGQLGNGSTGSHDVPVAVALPAGATPTAIAAGGAHALARLSNGTLLAWGEGADGQLGNGGTSSSDVPVAVHLPANTAVAAIAAGAAHSVALTQAGAVLCWGFDAEGQLGTGAGATSDRLVPTQVTLPAAVKAAAVTAEEYDTLVRTPAGAIYAFGANQDGELGNGKTTGSATPAAVNLPSGTAARAVGAGPMASGGLALVTP
jgi:alpha-tubulin suppressor-like RCC1 family protein